MRALARLLVQRRFCWAVVAASVLLASAGGYGALSVEQDDDVLKFLPAGNPDVAAFRAINERFGGLDVAVVGIEASPFEPDLFRRLKIATKALNDSKAIDFALSLANVQDFRPTEGGGIETGLLVPNMSDPAAAKKRVLAKELIVGNLVSNSGDAVIIYCFAPFGSNPRGFAGEVQKIVEANFAGEKKYWGGAPFVSTYIFDATQDDLRTLTPWAVIVIIAMIVLSFRDPIGASLALVSTGMGIVMSMGLMGFLGVQYNIVLSSMPVILFAVGSAYGIHVLACYYRLAASLPRERALEETVAGIGPVVFAAGMTTVAGLLSFVVMDIGPMRTFGVFTAFGIFCTLVLALTFIPAVMRLLNLGPKRMAAGAFNELVVKLVAAAQANKVVAGLVLAVVAITAGAYAGRVSTQMDQTAFFAEGSPPDEADRFLSKYFGGSMFAQVSLKGDFTEPSSLRQIQGYADKISMIEGVAAVQHAGQVIAQVNEAMAGARRIPDDSAKIKVLYNFLAGNPSVAQVITDDRKQALLHIKLSSSRADEVQSSLQAIEAVAGAPMDLSVQAYAAGRVRALLGVDLAAVNLALTATVETVAKDVVAQDMLRFLQSDEAVIELSPEQAQVVANTLAEHGADEVALKTAVPSDDEALHEDLVISTEGPLEESWRKHKSLARARAVAAKLGRAKDAERIADVLAVLDAPEVKPTQLELQVSGLPVLHRGLSNSVERNQVLSLSVALGLVLMILSWLFRSLWTGLLATAPTLLTLAVIYGGMGWLGVNLDIGTSMLASIIIGAGVDYAVHLVSAWGTEDDDMERAAVSAVRATGPAIWTNALMVAAGFFVLTLGEAKTLENVGGLTSAAMIVAALATFLTIPVLARKHRYSRPATAKERN